MLRDLFLGLIVACGAFAAHAIDIPKNNPDSLDGYPMASFGAMDATSGSMATQSWHIEAPDADIRVSHHDLETHALYVSSGRAISFEILRGTMSEAHHYRHDPGAPHFEMDLRILDNRQRTFYMSVGGHAPINESWVTAARADDDQFSNLKRWTDFELARDCLSILLSRGCPVGLEPEYDILVDAWYGLGKELERASEYDLSNDVPVGDDATLYRHKFHIQYADGVEFLRIVWDWADHSAAKVNVYRQDPYGLHGIWITNNHGRRADDPDMSLRCYENFWDRTNSTPASLYGCSTYYGIEPRRHLCNDDTLDQYLNVRENGDSYHITCADFYLRVAAPDCG